MEILAALREGPLNRSRLAQRCNINYGRLDDDMSPMQNAGWIAKEVTGGQEVNKLTEEGLKAYVQYIVLWNEWQTGVKLTARQERF